LGVRVWGVGEGGVIVTTKDNGKTWRVQQPIFQDLNQVRVIASNVWAVGDNGAALKSDIDSEKWSSVAVPSKAGLTDIAGDPTSSQLWIVGTGGVILHSSTGGQSWIQQSSPVNGELDAVLFLGGVPASLVVAGHGGTVAITHNAGMQWRVVLATGHILWTLSQSKYTKQLWAAGENGDVLLSDDVGETWNRINSGTTNPIRVLVPVAQGEKYYAFGDEALQTYTAFYDHCRIGHVSIQHVLNKFHAQVTLIGVPKSPVPQFSIRAVRANELDRVSPIELAASVWAPSDGSNVWNIDFDLSDVSPHSGESFVLQACLKRAQFSRCIPLPRVVAVSWINYNRDKTWLVPISVLLSVGLCLTSLLWLSPLTILSLYKRAVIYEAVEKSSIPGASIIAVILKGTILPFFAFHPETIKAWVLSYRQRFIERWHGDLNALSPELANELYVPLPIEVSGRIVTSPQPADLVPLLWRGLAIEIRGPGGIGKTTLLVQVAKWLSESNSKEWPPSIPILCEPYEGTLFDFVKGKIERVVSEEVPPELLRTMLKRGNIYLFVDGWSEFDQPMRARLIAGIEELQLKYLVISSRLKIDMGSLSSVPLIPTPLDSNTLLYFITSLLARLPEERSTLNTMELQLDLGNRIVHLLRSSENETPLTPLLVKLYVERAVELLFQGKTMDELPKTIGEAYFDFVLQLLRGSDIGDTAVALESLKALSVLSLGDQFAPGRFGWERAVEALLPIAGTGAQVILNKLVSAGLLATERMGLQVLVQFVLDPLAEFCAAYAYAQRCGANRSEWRKLAASVKGAAEGAHGFRTALSSVVSAYCVKGLCTVDANEILTSTLGFESEHIRLGAGDH
jgi:hypothetical protein